MDGVALLRRAREAGLALQVSGDKLIIRGPKRAEPMVRLLSENKPEVLAALLRAAAHDHAGADQTWHNRYATRALHWFVDGQRPWQEAQRLAFAELVLTWHRRYGARANPNRCAGCGSGLPASVGLVLDRDATRVHFDEDHGVDCIIAYGDRWRTPAVAGLRLLGIEAPAEEKS